MKLGGGGGVFIAFKSNIPLIEEPSLSSDAEVVWAKLCISNSKPVFVCSFYRPPNNLTGPISELRHTLNKLPDHNAAIIIAGDFNFPAIQCQWEEGAGCIDPVKSYTYGNDVNYLFIETVNDFGLEQFVTQPTRNNHILDLVFTSQPELISDINVVPGISNHEAVSFKIQFSSSAQQHFSTKITEKDFHNFKKVIESLILTTVLKAINCKCYTTC